MTITDDHSPDEGAMSRAVYFSNILGVDMGMFYKRRDYSTVVNGKNPIVAHEFLGDSVEGKDVVIIDDMIASGEVCWMLPNRSRNEKPNEYLSVLLMVFSQRDLPNLMNIMRRLD